MTELNLTCTDIFKLDFNSNSTSIEKALYTYIKFLSFFFNWILTLANSDNI